MRRTVSIKLDITPEQQAALGSQMACNAIRTVCDAYKVLKIKKTEAVPAIVFRQASTVHFDKRTYSLKEGAVFL